MIFVLQVKKADFIITQDNEKKVLDALANEISHKMSEINDQVDTLSKNLSTIDSSNKVEVKQLREEMAELNDHVETLKKDVFTMNCSNKAEVKQLQDKMKTLDIELSKVII